MTRGLRDYFSDDVGEILIDQPEAFKKAQEYMERFMPPEAQRKLKLYQDPVPLFTRYQIESQIESAYSHKVTLPSGGSLVYDHTEALGLHQHQTRRARPAAETSRRPRATPISRRPRKSRASSDCATSAA